MRVFLLATAAFAVSGVAVAQTSNTTCTPMFGGGMSCQTTRAPSFNPGPGMDFRLLTPPQNSMTPMQAFEAGRMARERRETFEAQQRLTQERDALAEQQRELNAQRQAMLEERGRQETLAFIREATRERSPEEIARANEAQEKLKAFMDSLGIEPGDWRKYAAQLPDKAD